MTLVAENDDGRPGPERLVAMTWLDLCGIARVRAIPMKHLSAKAEFGLSFPSCGQAMTLFGDIVDNQWGSIGDIRQIPVLSTLIAAPTNPHGTGLSMVLSEAMSGSGGTWDLCTRSFLRGVVDAFQSELGLTAIATFEHEFKLFGSDKRIPLSMTLEALRCISPLDETIVNSLEQAGIQVEAFEPEFAASQYEISCAPRDAVRAADEAVLLREIVRDCARWAGYQATFSPKSHPSLGGSGLHIHLSFLGKDGKPALYERGGVSNLSEMGKSFVAGVLRHARAILPFVAPGVISYYRLGPGKWSSGYAAYGTSNREAMIRVCALPVADDQRLAKSLNLEFRSADGLCNPYLALAMILRAGLQGIRDQLQPPSPLNVDPAKMSVADRNAMKLVPLPESLGEALDDLTADKLVCSWVPEPLLKTFVDLRRDELRRFADVSAVDACEKYMTVY